MSFELTPEEVSRVEIAEFLGIHLDPIGHVDLSTIVVLSTMYAIEFVALCYQLYHRNYPPLKVKNVPVMFSLYFGAVIWMLGDIFTSGLVHLASSPILQACRFTLIWCRVSLGSYYVTSLFALRTYALYHVFYLGKAFTGRVVYLSFGITIGSIFMFGIISTLVPVHMTVYYEDIMDMCYANHNYIIAVLVVIWIIWGLVAWMTWTMRRVSFCFSEHVEILSSFSILFTVVILNTVCLLVVTVYPASLAWRNILLYVNHVGASVGYWVVMWVPTYNCMFHREEYLRYWVDTLKEVDMER
ncbi:hypothetical protein GGI05_002986, partial [Coemansia sp. RSA 2603]